jgi:formylglycine-generating enzyme required for sulfatase activity
MGAQSKNSEKLNYDPDAFDREGPVHEVQIDAYTIGKYPVTVGEYRRFIDNGGYKKEKYWDAGGFGKYTEPGDWSEQQDFPTRPVTGVSWYEAMAYAAWAGGTLPTEAQWERAAKGPGKEYKKYPWGNKEPGPDRANWGKTGLHHPSPVGVFPANSSEEGIYDLAGNVWEWCSDWFDENYFKTSPPDNPKGPDSGKNKVVRGGAFYSDDYYIRCCDRYGFEPFIRNDYVGFRVVRVSS